MSPILFALYLEPLCRAIAGDVNIRGLTLPGGSVNVLAYADDLTVLCSSKSQVQAAVQHIGAFCTASGAQMNAGKSKGAWLGEWGSKPEQFLGISFADSVTNYLGVNLNPERLSTGRGGIDLNRLNVKVLEWHGRQMSLPTRAFVCNAVFFPTIWYPAQVGPCAQSEICKVHRFLATFVWESLFERMRRDNLFLSQKKGGLGLVNVELKLKVHRFMFFRSQRNDIVLSSFRVLGGNFLGEWLEGEAGSSRSRILKFYKEIEAAIKFFKDRFSDEYLDKVKRKTLYWDTLDMLIPVPLYRMWGGTAVESDVFKRLRRYPVRTATKNFFLRLHLRVLPVKTWLVQKGFFVPWSTNCALCPFPETLEHVILFCTNAELFWAQLRAALEVDLYVSWRSAMFLECGTGRDSRAFEVLTILGLHALWRSRTDHLHVVEGGKPAWRHFLDGFVYASSLIATTEQDGLECWETLKARLGVRGLSAITK